MIVRLQTQVHEAVKVMNEGQEQTLPCVARTAESGTALEHIVSAVNTILDKSGQIATAAEEQSRMAEEIDRNINRIFAVADQTARSSGQTNMAISDTADTWRS